MEIESQKSSGCYEATAPRRQSVEVDVDAMMEASSRNEPTILVAHLSDEATRYRPDPPQDPPAGRYESTASLIPVPEPENERPRCDPPERGKCTITSGLEPSVIQINEPSLIQINDNTWACQACTFAGNESTEEACSICGTPRGESLAKRTLKVPQQHHADETVKRGLGRKKRLLVGAVASTTGAFHSDGRKRKDFPTEKFRTSTANEVLIDGPDDNPASRYFGLDPVEEDEDSTLDATREHEEEVHRPQDAPTPSLGQNPPVPQTAPSSPQDDTPPAGGAVLLEASLVTQRSQFIPQAEVILREDEPEEVISSLDNQDKSWMSAAQGKWFCFGIIALVALIIIAVIVAVGVICGTGNCGTGSGSSSSANIETDPFLRGSTAPTEAPNSESNTNSASTPDSRVTLDPSLSTAIGSLPPVDPASQSTTEPTTGSSTSSPHIGSTASESGLPNEADTESSTPAPSTHQMTLDPSTNPAILDMPVHDGLGSPTIPSPATSEPTPLLTNHPTPVPSKELTPAPTPVPTLEPTQPPTMEPSPEPTPVPTLQPTPEPTPEPTQPPTIKPSPEPTPVPTTTKPTPAPTTPLPTAPPLPAVSMELVLKETFRGRNGDNNFGTYLEFSRDGKTLAIGADGDPENYVQVLRLDSSNDWVDKGGRIVKQSRGGGFGHRLDINADGTVLVVGDPRLDEPDTNTGKVRVYDYDSDDDEWEKQGQSLIGSEEEAYFGWDVAISDDGNTIVASARTGSVGGKENCGYAQAFAWDDGSWEQVGQTLEGEEAGDEFGRSVAMSGDGRRVAIGAHRGAEGKGRAYVYDFDSSRGLWIQVGQAVDGDSTSDELGVSIDLSQDGNVLAIGCNGQDQNGITSDAGMLEVYQLEARGVGGQFWSMYGGPIHGEKADDKFGQAGQVSLSNDGQLLGVAAPNHSDREGKAYLYAFVGSDWMLMNSRYGAATTDRLGHGVNVAGDGSWLATGAPQDGDGGAKGYVRVYDIQ